MPVINALKIKVKGELPEIVEKAVAEGFISKIVKNGTIIECPPATEKGHVDGRYPYKIPAFLEKDNVDYAFTIYTCEQGGASPHSGHAHIICGESGKPIAPYLTDTTSGNVGGTHAHFCIFEKFIVVEHARRFSSNVTCLTKIMVERPPTGDTTAMLLADTLWRGVPKELPAYLGKYAPAVKAAENKANHCPNCHCIHYAAPRR